MKRTKRKHKFPNAAIFPDELMDDESIPKEEELTWCYIFRYCKNKDSAHPSTTRPLNFLAEKRGLSERQLQRHIKHLEEEGWLSSRRRYNNSSIIIINWEKFQG